MGAQGNKLIIGRERKQIHLCLFEKKKRVLRPKFHSRESGFTDDVFYIVERNRDRKKIKASVVEFYSHIFLRTYGHIVTVKPFQF